MNRSVRRRLEAGLHELGFESAEDLATGLLRFSDLLLDENRRTNLVGAKTPEQLIGPHLLDSLAPLVGRQLAEPIVDVGSGAGLPGVPAALAWPTRRFVLLEPRAKRAHFIEQAIGALGLANIEVRQESVAAALEAGWRGRAGTALARALAKPAAALELALPLLKSGGRLILYQGRAAAPDREQRRTAGRLGGRLTEARRIEVPYLGAVRHVWVFEKR